jgi:hypothetical protein
MFQPNRTPIFCYVYENLNYKDFMYAAGATQYANALPDRHFEPECRGPCD